MNNTPTTILCPIDHRWQGTHNPLLFGVNHLETIAREQFGREVRVRLMPFVETRWDKRETLWLNLKMTVRILLTRHDILYYGIDPNNIMLLALLKSFGLYRRPMYAWKYVALTRSKNPITRWFKRRIYSAFDCVFMLTEGHVAHSVAAGIIPSAQCRYVEWGNDLRYIDAITPLPLSGGAMPHFVSCGKAMRDFDTLCRAFQGLPARLDIYAPRHWGGTDYAEVIARYEADNIHVHYVEELDHAGYGSLLEYLYAALKAADCSVIICKKVNFGVGYTSVVDAMACGAAVIATQHPDNPVDIDGCGIGLTVPAADVEALRQTVLRLVNHPDELAAMRQRSRQMAERDHNIIYSTAKALQTVLGAGRQ